MKHQLWDHELTPGLRLVNLTAKLLAEGRKEDAICAAIGACEIESERPEPFVALAGAYNEVHGLEKYQREACVRALAINAKDALAWHNLSLAHMRLYAWEAALESATKAHSLDRSNPYHMLQGAAMFSQLGDPETAIKLLEGALALFHNMEKPDTKIIQDTYLARALCHLELGHWEKYFRGWDKRLEFGDPDKCEAAGFHARGALWRPGQPIDAEHAVVLNENGLGDQIQFLRLAQLFKERNNLKTITVRHQEPLNELFAGIPWLSNFESEQAAIYLAPVDLVEWAYLEGMSDPFGRWTGPYIYEPDEIPVKNEPGKTAIGFCWQGNPNHAYDWARSMPLKAWLDWAESKRDTCTFHSMQRGQTRVPLPDWIETCDQDGFKGMAKVINSCHVIVGPDTGLLHMAGAMGKPTVMLHSFHQEWRWKLGTDFYGPTFRHLKQNVRGDWNELLSRLGPELDNLLDGIEQSELMEAMAH